MPTVAPMPRSGEADNPPPIRSAHHAVPVILWPEEEQRRRQLSLDGVPRLLVLAGGRPPADLDIELEDWVRVPADQGDINLRIAILAVRSGVNVPFLDEDDLLHCGARWVALPASEARLAAPLVEHFGTLVTTETLLATAEQGRVSNVRSIRVGVTRLRQRIEPLGLTIATIRARGYAMAALRPGSFVFDRPSARRP